MHSLSNFILANLPVEERIQGKLALCAKWGNNPVRNILYSFILLSTNIE
jgi:hypothetical protein